MKWGWTTSSNNLESVLPLQDIFSNHFNYCRLQWLSSWTDNKNPISTELKIEIVT